MAIKQTPEDFVVEEELEPAVLAEVAARADRGQVFALYRIRKRGLTTPEMVAGLGRAAKVRDSLIAAAGLKDKHAITTQHVTIRITPGRAPPPQRLQGPGFTAERLGFVPRELGASAIRRNRFTLVIRELTRSAVDEVHAMAGHMMPKPGDPAAGDATLRIVNYYGNQRFGSARAGQGFLAPLLIRGKFEEALKLAIAVPHRQDLHKIKRFKTVLAERWGQWRPMLSSLPPIAEKKAVEHLVRNPDDFRGAFAALPYFTQQIAVEAYQSWLWNEIAARLLTDRLGASGRLWVVDDRFGQLVFPEAAAVPGELVGLNLPLPGKKTEPREPWRRAAEQVFAAEGIKPGDLKIPGLDRPWFPEVPRTLFMDAGEFRLDEPRHDESVRKGKRYKLTTSFTLPRGGYATIVLRALGQ